MHDYMRVIHSVDRNVGRVLDYMEKSGLLENTIIVYTSDQGFYMGEHGWFDKRFMYEESFRTPMLVRFPGGVKLIHFYNDIDVWELYDLQNDPMEMHNIYNEPGNEALIDSLKTELNKLQEQYDDPIETELATAKK